MVTKAVDAISNGLASGRHWAGSGRKWCLDCRARVRHLKVFLIASLNEGVAGADLTFPQQLRQLGDIGRYPSASSRRSHPPSCARDDGVQVYFPPTLCFLTLSTTLTA